MAEENQSVPYNTVSPGREAVYTRETDYDNAVLLSEMEVKELLDDERVWRMAL